MKTVIRIFLILAFLACLGSSIADTIPLKPPILTAPMTPSSVKEPAAPVQITHNEPPASLSSSSTGKLWNLQDADIISVINEISQETGKNFVIDPRVQGKITLISNKPIKAEDAYDVFLSILELLGYSAIQNGNVVKVVPNLESSEMATRVASNIAPGKGDEVVVRVIPLEHVTANQLIPVIRPLLPQWSNVSAYPPGNVLILVGRASNLERISEIIRNVDTASNNEIDILPLKQASATQVATVLNNLQTASRATGEMPTVFITADERSNSILLSGNKSSRLRMRILVSQLDSPTTGAQDNTEVVYLRYLQAKTLAPVLGKVAQNILGKGGATSGEVSSTTPGESGPASPAQSATMYRNAEGNYRMGVPPKDAASTAPENKTNIQAEPNTNALIITAPPLLMRTLNSVIAKLDVRPAQVHVEAIIVQIDQSDLKNLGIQWGSVTPAGDVADVSSPSSNTFGFPPLGAGVVGLIPHEQIHAVLNALENKTGIDILSTPSLVVLDNQQAILEVGTDIATENGQYATTGTTATVAPFNTIDRKKVTLKLKVTPQINLGNAVRLRIVLTNDSLQDPQSTSLTPSINTSSIDNKVILDSGSILVLGGLISNNVTENVTKVPILGDIPIIGKLFQNKNTSVQKKNLVMFIQPTIMHSDEDATMLTNTKYDQIRKVQIKGPLDLSKLGEQKRENILPRWRENFQIPAPFGDTK